MLKRHLRQLLAILTPEQPPEPSITVEIDWEAYFRDFDALHGGDPVFYGTPEEAQLGQGQLLYRDGWRYDRKHVSGPEYSAPTDEVALRRLQLVYWTRRADVIRAEASKLDRHIYTLRSLQSERSAPLQPKVKGRNGTPPVMDLATLQERQRQLRELAEECTDMIALHQPALQLV